MGRKAIGGGALFAVMLALPIAASAQVQSLKDFQVSDVKQMGEKFVGLAEAFDESQYDWRPMEGVRSVRDQLVLAAAEANLFPGMWGGSPASDAAGQFGAETERLAAMSKAQLTVALEKAFAHLAESLEGMSDESRMADGNTFGQQMTNAAGISYAMTDTHEHLGKLIAYARMNHIVPPWSREGGND